MGRFGRALLGVIVLLAAAVPTPSCSRSHHVEHMSSGGVGKAQPEKGIAPARSPDGATAAASQGPPASGHEPDVKEVLPLPSYEIIDGSVYDAPIKTEVVLSLVVSKNVTAKGLRQLLEKLYAEVSARSGFTYHANPTSIHIFIYASKDYHRSGQPMARINKAAAYSEPSIVIDEEQVAQWGKPPQTKFGLSEDQRRRIWTETIRAQDRAAREAEQRIPNPSTPWNEPAAQKQFRKQGDLQGRLVEQYEAVVARSHGITTAQLKEIDVEAGLERWPMPPEDD